MLSRTREQGRKKRAEKEGESTIGTVRWLRGSAHDNLEGRVCDSGRGQRGAGVVPWVRSRSTRGGNTRRRWCCSRRGFVGVRTRALMELSDVCDFGV